MKYNLSDYVLSIKSTDSSIDGMFGTITIGGDGSYTESISVTLNQKLWSVSSYATGGYVHDKNVARDGNVEIRLNQLSDQVRSLIRLVNTYYDTGSSDAPLTMTLTDRNERIACEMKDVYPSEIPTQDFQSTAQPQTWSFACGKIVFS